MCYITPPPPLPPIKDTSHLIISSRIPINSYTEVLDVEGDGNCGFRALAIQIYGD
ncbi:unnamed protein product [Mucor hiemalis]